MICAALITAGGSGVRMGADRPKQYLEVGGFPILARTIAAYDKHPLIDYIVVTVPQADESYCQTNILGKFRFNKVIRVTTGGVTRQESVHNGLELTRDSDWVAIHDGVRPFVSESIITDVIYGAIRIGGCIAALPVRETVKKKNDDFLETVPRENLWLARTPQVFRNGLIIEAHEDASLQNMDVTDDAALFERTGRKVGIVEDTFHNIKITSRDDMIMAEMIARCPDYMLELRSAWSR